MDDELEWIVTNARVGRGPCEACPVQATDNCQFITPGCGSLTASVLFVRAEPTDGINWDVQPPWDSSTDIVRNSHEWAAFLDALSDLYLDPLDMTTDDIWLTSTINCPPTTPDQETERFSTERAFACCAEYLRREINQVMPEVIVTLGSVATKRTLHVFGEIDESIELHVDTDLVGQCQYDTEPPVVISPAISAASVSAGVYETVREAITTYWTA